MSGAHVPNDAAWHSRVWAAAAAALALGCVLGFVVIPLVQGASIGLDSFTAFCRALGVLPGTPARLSPASKAAPQPVTNVAWTVAILDEIDRGDRTRGGKLAQERCVACHAPDGSSAAPNIPRMAGQSVFAIYKQLHDFKSGARVNEIMSALVQDLNDQAIADLATYYGHLKRGDADLQNPFVGPEVVNLVVNGDVARGLPPCVACHGARAAGPVEMPTLSGQHPDYLEAQLQAFAKGDRHNDIYHRMRDVASRLMPDEMHMLAIYYAGQR